MTKSATSGAAPDPLETPAPAWLSGRERPEAAHWLPSIAMAGLCFTWPIVLALVLAVCFFGALIAERRGA